MRKKANSLISRFISSLNLINRTLILLIIVLIFFSCSNNNNKTLAVSDKEIDSVSVKSLNKDITNKKPKTIIAKSPTIQKKQSKLDSASVLFIFLDGVNKRKIDNDISISIKYLDNLYEYSLNNQDFFVGNGYGMPHTIKYATAREGYSTIEYRIDKLGENLSSGKLKIQLKKDWARDIYLQISSYNPIHFCFG